MFGYRVTVSEWSVPAGMRSVIQISSAESRDGGHYQCRASNPYALADHTLYLSVLGLILFLVLTWLKRASRYLADPGNSNVCRLLR